MSIHAVHLHVTVDQECCCGLNSSVETSASEGVFLSERHTESRSVQGVLHLGSQVRGVHAGQEQGLRAFIV